MLPSLSNAKTVWRHRCAAGIEPGQTVIAAAPQQGTAANTIAWQKPSSIRPRNPRLIGCGNIGPMGPVISAG